ncbi:hypothetical protein [Streptomyces vietnamensis]|uniref:hypothetical protein n=1 Tax=Streptomyces vietnamensis TaxID=362257 RepID=UPI000A4D2F85|nr:hypothetical protein [Streptomyces vietnamensis]
MYADNTALEQGKRTDKSDCPPEKSLPEADAGPERPCPWWHEVSTYAFQSAFADVDRAWRNWLDSLRGVRAGRRVGYLRFKKKGRARASFRLHHDVKKPSIRLATYRRLRLPTIGEVRLHDSGKRLGRLVERGRAVVQSATVSRAGHRWYASVLRKVAMTVPEQPSQRQRRRGTAGVDLGVKTLAALSQSLDPAAPTSVLVAPRRLARAEQRLVMMGLVEFGSVRTSVNDLSVSTRRNRAVATRYGKLTVRYEATVLVAAINEWL